MTNLNIKQKTLIFLKFLKNANKLKLIIATIVVLVVGAGITFTGLKYYSNSHKIDPLQPSSDSEQESAFVIPEEAYENLEKQEDDAEECAGLYKINNVPGEDIRCSYGPEVTFVNSVRVNGGNSTPGPGVQCSGDNVSGIRVQAIYAFADDQADRYDELHSYFQEVADHVSNSVAVSAEKTGGQAQLKWVTNSDCRIEIAKVKMRATQDDSFSETISAVMNDGYDDPGKLYMIWTDANLVCGIADFISDDRPDPNINASSSGISARYNRIDRSCWGQSELHEIVHNMGAVQHTAPHSTGGGHCFDGYEVMCYGDGGVSGESGGCDIGQAYLLDCNNDDYFNANPEPGSYLDTNWNVFNSNYLITNKTKLADPEDTTPPPKPYDVNVYDIIQDGFKIKWKLKGTEDIERIHVEVDGKTKVSLLGPVTSTYSYGLKPATKYTVRVVTIDANGNASYSEIVDFTTLSTPTTELGSIVPHDLKIKSINGSVVTLTAIIDRIPKEQTDYIVRRSNGVGSSGYSFSATNTPKTYEFVDFWLYPQTIVSYHIRVMHPGGGEIARTDEIPFNFTGTSESNPPPAPTGFSLKKDATNFWYIQYDQMVDDSGIVHHYSFVFDGPDGYKYTLGDSPTRFMYPSPQPVSGKTYTATATVTDIWGNVSAPTVTVFIIP